MKITLKKYAQALYELTENRSDEEIKLIVGKFVKNLAENNKLGKSREMIEQFDRIWCKNNDLVEAEIVSFRKLSPANIKGLEEYIKESAGTKKALITQKIDKSILGGVVIKYGSTILDGSLKARLNGLKDKMIK